MVAGHPFKGGNMRSVGYLSHPDMKRFNIGEHALFAPPRPNALVTAMSMGLMARAATQVPSFGDFFASQFAGRSFDVSNENCSKALEGMKRCYENHSSANPQQACQYYINGFERFACGKQ